MEFFRLLKGSLLFRVFWCNKASERIVQMVFASLVGKSQFAEIYDAQLVSTLARFV